MYVYILCERSTVEFTQDLLTNPILSEIGVLAFSWKTFVQNFKFKMPKDRLQALKAVSQLWKFISCDLLNHVTEPAVLISNKWFWCNMFESWTKQKLTIFKICCVMSHNPIRQLWHNQAYADNGFFIYLLYWYINAMILKIANNQLDFKFFNIALLQ